MRHIEPGAARFTVERGGGDEWLRVPARRNWFVLLFVAVWLTMWTAGGAAAVGALFTRFEPFLLVWLGFWALGWLFAVATVAWQLGGAELIGIDATEVHHRVTMPGYGSTRVYRRDAVHAAAPNAVAGMWGFGFFQPSYPPLFNFPFGSVKFRYGARTIYLAAGLDEAEGALIAEWMNARLAQGAAAGTRPA